MSEEFTTKAELIEATKAARFKLEKLLARLSHEQVLNQVLDNGWTVKDILAHIVAWEVNMIGWVGTALAGEVPTDLPGDDDAVNAINEEMYIGSKNRDLPGILKEFEASYKRALQTAEDAPEDALFDSDRFEWREGRPLWMMVAANMVWHYREHYEQLMAHFGEE